MISAIIPTWNAEAHLPQALSSLVPAAVEGLVREVIVVDGGSTDRTLDIVDGAGAELVKGEAGRGAQLDAGARRARSDWLLFLNPDTYLDPRWEREAQQHIARVESGRRRSAAASFRLTLDDEGVLPRTMEALVALRAGLFKLPDADQGLLIPRVLYDEVGGFGALPAMEDMDLARRLGRSRVVVLNARIVANAERYRRAGYLSRMARSQACLGLCLLGVPVRTLARLQGRSTPTREPVAGPP